MANELEHEFVVTAKGVTVVCPKARGRCARLYRPEAWLSSGTVKYFGTDQVIWDDTMKGKYLSPPLGPGLFLLTKFASAGVETDNSESIYFEVDGVTTRVISRSDARLRLLNSSLDREGVMAAAEAELCQKVKAAKLQIEELQREVESLESQIQKIRG